MTHNFDNINDELNQYSNDYFQDYGYHESVMTPPPQATMDHPTVMPSSNNPTPANDGTQAFLEFDDYPKSNLKQEELQALGLDMFNIYANELRKGVAKEQTTLFKTCQSWRNIAEGLPAREHSQLQHNIKVIGNCYNEHEAGGLIPSNENLQQMGYLCYAMTDKAGLMQKFDKKHLPSHDNSNEFAPPEPPPPAPPAPKEQLTRMSVAEMLAQTALNLVQVSTHWLNKDPQKADHQLTLANDLMATATKAPQAGEINLGLVGKETLARFNELNEGLAKETVLYTPESADPKFKNCPYFKNKGDYKAIVAGVDDNFKALDEPQAILQAEQQLGISHDPKMHGNRINHELRSLKETDPTGYLDNLKGIVVNELAKEKLSSDMGLTAQQEQLRQLNGELINTDNWSDKYKELSKEQSYFKAMHAITKNKIDKHAGVAVDDNTHQKELETFANLHNDMTAYYDKQLNEAVEQDPSDLNLKAHGIKSKQNIAKEFVEFVNKDEHEPDTAKSLSAIFDKMFGPSNDGPSQSMR